MIMLLVRQAQKKKELHCPQIGTGWNRQGQLDQQVGGQDYPLQGEHLIPASACHQLSQPCKGLQ